MGSDTVRKTDLNPYRIGAWCIRERLRWDVKPESWRSKNRLKSMLNSMAGKKAIICCNGPSLNFVDFSLLNGIYVIGLNKINLLFDKTEFRPNCIVAVNDFVVEQNKLFYNETDIDLFVSYRSANFITARNNVTFLHTLPFGTFAQDVSWSLTESGTVTNVALQLAFHLGFDEVALVGADHSFAQRGNPNSTVTASEADTNHFVPNYFAPGMKWQLADLLQSEIGYRMARENFEAANRKIFNCTVGGGLEVFERKPLLDFVKSGKQL